MSVTGGGRDVSVTTLTPQRAAQARVWLGGPYGDVLATLGAAIREREGVLVLTGDVGTGKSLLTQAVLQKLRDREILVGELPYPHLDPLGFLRTVAMAYGLPSAFETREAFQLEFEEFLRRTAADRKKVLFVIDEAQQLPSSLFPEIERLLRPESGPDGDGRAPFSVLLVGQPQLESVLDEPRHGALARRITARCRLQPLTEQEVAKYLAHRLRVGAGGAALSTAVIREIHRQGEGVPRLIDQVAEKMLVAPPAMPLPAAGPVIASSNGTKRSERRGRTHGRQQHGRLHRAAQVFFVALAGGGVILTLAVGVTRYRHAQTPTDVQTRTDLQSPAVSNVATTPETPQPGVDGTERRSEEQSPSPALPSAAIGIAPTRAEPPAPPPSPRASERRPEVAPALKKPQTPSLASRPPAAVVTPSGEERRPPRPREEPAQIPVSPTPTASTGATDPDPGAIIDWLLKERARPQ